MLALGKKPEKPEVVLNLGDESLIAISMTTAAAMFGVPSTVIAPRNRPGEKLDTTLPLFEEAEVSTL